MVSYPNLTQPSFYEDSESCLTGREAKKDFLAIIFKNATVGKPNR